MASPDLCIDTLGAAREEPVGVYPCKGPIEKPGYRQTFTMRNYRDIFIHDTNTDCLDSNHGKVLIFPCKFNQKNQYFRYDPDTQQV
jgi:Ricin-type beta-trefoil lectin domain